MNVAPAAGTTGADRGAKVTGRGTSWSRKERGPAPGALLVLVRRREVLAVEPEEAARLYADQRVCAACGRA